MKQLDNFRFPAFVEKLGKRIPSPVAGLPLMLMLELARRQSWLIAPETLYGKNFRLQIEDLGINLFFHCEQGKFKAMPAPDSANASANATADVSLSACAIDFFKLASGMEDADTLFFRRRLKMEGDTALGIAVKYWIDASERPEWLQKMAEKLIQV
jgi:predicted lipid carrier protein YhbT